jgi:hypothetical protein
MPFIGKNPTAGFSTIVKDDLTADGSTTAFTLSKNVASANDIAVFVGNVRQEPTDAYSVSGTTLTMTAAPSSGINFYVLHIAGTLESSVIPADGTISTAKIQSGAVTSAKLDTNLSVAGNLTVTGDFVSPDTWVLVDKQSGSSTNSSNVQLGTLSSSYKFHKVFFNTRWTQGGSSNAVHVFMHWGGSINLRGGFIEMNTSGVDQDNQGINGGYGNISRNMAAGTSGYQLTGEFNVIQNHTGGGYHCFIKGNSSYVRSGEGPVSGHYGYEASGANSITTFYVNADETAGSGIAFTYDVTIYGWN